MKLKLEQKSLIILGKSESLGINQATEKIDFEGTTDSFPRGAWELEKF